MEFIPTLSLGLNNITRKITDDFKEKNEEKSNEKAVIFIFSVSKNHDSMYFHLYTHTHTT